MRGFAEQCRKSFFLHYRYKLCNAKSSSTITEKIQKEHYIMSTRLFISSLTAAFSLGTAFGLAIDEAITKTGEPCIATEKQLFPLNKPASETPNIQADDFDHGDQADKHQYPVNKPEPKTPYTPSDSLVCHETSPGVSRCWPRAHAPAPDQDLACIESGNEALCYPAPNPKGPKLGL